MRPPSPPPDEFDLAGPDPDLIERLVEERLAERFEAESFLWRFRLISIETYVMGALVLIAGLALRQPILMVLRAGVLIAAAYFVTGLIMLGLSAWAVDLAAYVRRWWQG